ncbi:transposase [Neobacillus rhizosphaerae]|uniref:transposase n=1 Tax=Neobacillus rhizosphaerae TaxID=2880965 RepID=UPI002228772E|nr:transposase [Neobacillus rhizosphaerae]
MYGYQRVQTWLEKTYELKMNHKRVQRHMGELRIQGGHSKEETILREEGSLRCFRQPS